MTLSTGLPSANGQDTASVESFGWQWTERQVVGTTREFYRMIFSSRGIWYDHFDGKIVADVGSGMGRFTWALAQMTKAHKIISVELSPAAAGKQRDYITDPRVEFVQGDLASARFEADAIVCAGVIQHVAQPEAAIRNLLGNLRDGGELFISFYLKTPVTLGLEPLRMVLKRLPKEALWALTPLLAPIFMVRRDGRALGFKTAMHTAYDWFGGHAYQHYFRDREIPELFARCSVPRESIIRISKGLYRVRKGELPLHLDDTMLFFPPDAPLQVAPTRLD